MFGELVTAVTQDKVRLDGLLSQPAEQAVHQSGVDAAVLVHGLGGNFYQSRLLKHFAMHLLHSGVATLLVNTRGHDYLNTTPRMGRAATLGAAVEVIDECKHDLHAWVEYLTKRDHQRILLLGHSLGAIKSLYSQAHLPHPQVVGIAAYSATKLSFDSLISSSGGQRFVHFLNLAQERVAEKRGDDLIFVDFPFPTWISAKAYLAKYNDGDRYNWLSFTDRISVPVLAAFGAIEMEENPAFAAMAHDLQHLQQDNFQIETIDRADHFYSACFAPAAEALTRWLNQLGSV